MSKLRPLLINQEPPPVPAVHVDLNLLSHFFRQFGADCEASRFEGDLIDVWAVSGLERIELRNAAVLAWLFDAKETHGRGSSILRHFFRRLEKECNGRFPLPTDDMRNYSVLTECYPLDSTENRVDIIIDGPQFIAFIEVKIDAIEGERQIKRYFELAQAMALVLGKTYFCIIYLSRESHPQLSIDSPHVIPATWKHVAGAIDEAVRSTSGTVRTFGDRVLMQFASHAARF